MYVIYRLNYRFLFVLLSVINITPVNGFCDEEFSLVRGLLLNAKINQKNEKDLQASTTKCFSFSSRKVESQAPLHFSGSVIVKMEDKDLLSETLFEDLGCSKMLNQIKKGNRTPEEAEKYIDEVVADFIQQGPSDQELEKVRNQAETNNQFGQIEVMNRAMNLAYSALLGDPDLINTDLIMPSKAFRLPKNEQHTLCFEAVRPEFAREVKAGDIVVAGENFGMGSSRPIGDVMRGAGIAAVIAESINGLFFRNSINYAFPAMECPGVMALFNEGDVAQVNFHDGAVRNLTAGKSITAKALPAKLLDLLQAGGIYPLLEQKGIIEPQT